MPSQGHRINFPGGGFAIACTRGPRRKLDRCAYCSSPGVKLCDGPGAKPGKTCDKPVCADHSKHVGEDRDICIACAWPGAPMPPVSRCRCGKQVILATTAPRVDESQRTEAPPGDVALMPAPSTRGAWWLTSARGVLVATVASADGGERRRWVEHICATR